MQQGFVRRRVEAPPDPLAIAARLRPLGDLAVLAGHGGRSFVLAGAAAASAELVPDGEHAAPWDGPRWVGLVPYEAGRGLERRRADARPAPHHERPAWRRYDACVAVERGVVEVLGAPAAALRLQAAMREPTPIGDGRLELRATPPDEEHRARVEAALERIARGELYQVNLARCLSLRVTGDPLAVFARMHGRAATDLGAVLAFDGEPLALSTTPELFLRASLDGRVETQPIKGTRPRGIDAAADARLRAELDADPKERAELAMIIDLERNDLGRVARVGSVRLSRSPVVVTHPTLHHREATVSAHLRDGTSWSELVRATFPSGSVTGAPKVAAMETIAALEPVRRGLYTGAFGHVAWDGTLVLAMAIRTLTVLGEEGRYHTGGGIVADSDPGREVEETRIKALQVAPDPRSTMDMELSMLSWALL